ncbi:AGC/PDK1 protein kinase [Tremella mesenterica]|uniref:non-specific serine/threonine protein kinase n=1 Tax=Tremella mesenterica TaxID=5217 RepID=A0A4Q1BWH3_TREME|nr:AGC/PDK1 protein kinase [Tremella mesenterica]
MATTMQPSPIPTPSLDLPQTTSSSTSPKYPVYPLLSPNPIPAAVPLSGHGTGTASPSVPLPSPGNTSAIPDSLPIPGCETQATVQRTDSTSSSHSATTNSSTSSLIPAPIRLPPIETRTATTTLPIPAPEPRSPPRTRRGSTDDSLPRGFTGTRNGPRVSQPRPGPPAIITSPPTTHSSVPSIGLGPGSSQTSWSPTTPRAWSPWWDNSRPETPEDGPPRVLVSNEEGVPGPSRGRPGSTPGSPAMGEKGHRTLSVDGRRPSKVEEKERRGSHASQMSGGKGKPSLKDYIIGEELGRGSYSVVVRAIAATSNTSPTSPRPPRQYAIKIINQAHLVAEKKAKYAMIERDALIRLSTPRQASPTAGRGHRRGMSSSSSAGQTAAGKRKSTASLGSSSGRRDSSTITPSMPIPQRDRLSVATSLTDSTSTGYSSPFTSPYSSAGHAPMSPQLMAGRRPSRSADPPEVVPERSEDGHSTINMKPPSPVKEEYQEEQLASLPSDRTLKEKTRLSFDEPESIRDKEKEKDGGKDYRDKLQTPKKRRQSLAPSERSVKSTKSTLGHPGIIRVYSTFNDSTSLYFVLDLAKNGEMLSHIRKHGSLDVESARYYSAQLIDTIEFMLDKGVIHRDLKPENILLDDEMRIKITDFGSAKLIYKAEPPTSDDARKRSFVGSADFVSPEVLRNELAVSASDIWAFGCILYHFIVGKPPFRGATDYLTFQKILKREMSFPEGFDPDAQALVDLVLNLDPDARPSIPEIKAHAFFSTVDWTTLWTCPPPSIRTGLTQPVNYLGSVDPQSDVWAVFDDEVSDGGFEYDSPQSPLSPTVPEEIELMDNVDHSQEPRIDREAAHQAVKAVHPSISERGNEEECLRSELEPPRPSWMGGGQRSARTSSSSSGNRTALTGLLESMKIQSPIWGGSQRGGSSRTSRTSVRSEEMRIMLGQSKEGQAHAQGQERWQSLLLTNEKITYHSPILLRPASTHIPSFLLPAPKRRHLILTDFPRLMIVKDDPSGPVVKNECVFVVRPSVDTVTSQHSGVGPSSPGVTSAQVGGTPNRVVEIQEKGSKGFVVQTAGNAYHFVTEDEESKQQWILHLRRVGV